MLGAEEGFHRLQGHDEQAFAIVRMAFWRDSTRKKISVGPPVHHLLSTRARVSQRREELECSTDNRLPTSERPLAFGAREVILSLSSPRYRACHCVPGVASNKRDGPVLRDFAAH